MNANIQTVSAETEDRRVADKEWKESVDKRLEEGGEKFDNLLTKLSENTTTTQQINKKLDDHVSQYQDFTKQMQPAADAIETMQAGVRVLGNIGHGVAWIGKAVRKTIVWIAPIVAFVIAIWHFLVNGTFNWPSK